MKTLSQLMHDAMKLYHSESFMCNVVNDELTNITEEQREDLKSRIKTVMPGYATTLTGYLYENCEAYRVMANDVAAYQGKERGRYVSPRSCTVMYSGALFALRCDFWKGFIANLEADGL